MTVTADAADRQAGAQARDARDVQALLGFRHRAADHDVVDLGRVEPGRASGLRAMTARRHLVRPRVRRRALRRLADGVRTAETITASLMAPKSREQFLERFADLLRLAVEQVVGAVDDDAVPSAP